MDQRHNDPGLRIFSTNQSASNKFLRIIEQLTSQSTRSRSQDGHDLMIPSLSRVCGEGSHERFSCSGEAVDDDDDDDDDDDGDGHAVHEGKEDEDEMIVI
ncbi:hypothetical protein PoB_005317300 [Plakobranchus ocellatus]|uniref:Uncharacterized protein n=1 Tax=Plakobranchus ocellatus TaxID=259542 RepID=A0AAV4C6Q2_9GAST|nr:hypothetical protein PoB_005317300 [Plakobranchus ocellatus]